MTRKAGRYIQNVRVKAGLVRAGEVKKTIRSRGGGVPEVYEAVGYAGAVKRKISR